MRYLTPCLLCLTILGTSGAPAQIPEGTLVLSNLTDLSNPAQNGPGSLHLMNPATGAFTTLNASLTTLGFNRYGPSWVEMDVNNVDLVVSYRAISPTNERLMHAVSPTGAILSTLFRDIGSTTPIRNFDLDHDDTWILTGGRIQKSNLWSFNHRTRVFTTLCDVTNPTGLVNSMAIDRAPGAPVYLLGKKNSLSSAVLMVADRSGILGTLSTAPDRINSVDVDRATGEYITGSGGPGREYGRVSRMGAFKPLYTTTGLFNVAATFVDQEHTCWLTGFDLITQPVPPNSADYVPAIYRFDLAGTLITFHRISGYKQSTFLPTGLTRYGSRRIVTSGSGKPGTTVTVRIQSRKPSDAGMAYQLACALTYTSGLKMPGGEYLDLTPDSLFFITASGVLPGLFKDFTGFLDASGNAAASVNIPKGLPPGLGITVFVSGIVLDPKVPGGVSTVGNTHWFVLS